MLCSSDPSDLPPHVDRHPDQTRVLLCPLLDRPLDGRGGIGGKLESQSVVELVDRSGECKVSFLDEVKQGNVEMRVLAGDPEDQAEICLDQGPLRALVAGCLATKECALLSPRQERYSAHSAGVKLEWVLDLVSRAGLV